jgi:ribonuclease HI
MPWVRARLRDSLVYARSDANGALVVEGGAVEVRYKPTDGKLYKARVANLVVTDATPLPDETCSEAKAVEKGAAKQAAPAMPADAIVVYADGACSGNPGPCGLGVVSVDGAQKTELSEYLGIGTNNIAELTAILRALELLPDPKRAMLINTDSQYSIGVLSKGWKAKANQELVASIKRALGERPNVKLAYVPGHAGVAGNEHADQLARLAVQTRATSKKTR